MTVNTYPGFQGFYRPSDFVGGVEWVVVNEHRTTGFTATAIDLRIGGTGGAAQPVPPGAKAVLTRSVVFNYTTNNVSYDIQTPAGNSINSLRPSTTSGVTVEGISIIPLGIAADAYPALITHVLTIGTSPAVDIAIIGLGWLF